MTYKVPAASVDVILVDAANLITGENGPVRDEGLVVGVLQKPFPELDEEGRKLVWRRVPQGLGYVGDVLFVECRVGCRWCVC